MSEPPAPSVAHPGLRTQQGARFAPAARDSVRGPSRAPTLNVARPDLAAPTSPVSAGKVSLTASVRRRRAGSRRRGAEWPRREGVWGRPLALSLGFVLPPAGHAAAVNGGHEAPPFTRPGARQPRPTRGLTVPLQRKDRLTKMRRTHPSLGQETPPPSPATGTGE